MYGILALDLCFVHGTSEPDLVLSRSPRRSRLSSVRLHSVLHRKLHMRCMCRFPADGSPIRCSTGYRIRLSRAAGNERHQPGRVSAQIEKSIALNPHVLRLISLP